MERKKRVGKDNNMKSNAEERGSGGKREEDKHKKRELKGGDIQGAGRQSDLRSSDDNIG